MNVETKCVPSIGILLTYMVCTLASCTTTTAAESGKRMQQVRHFSLDTICQNRNEIGLNDLLGPSGVGKVSTIEILEEFRDKITGLVTSPHLGADGTVVGVPDGDEIRWQPFEMETLFGPAPPEPEGGEPGSLSAGEQRKKQIAPAKANDPEGVPEDEPAGDLDPATVSSLEDLVAELRGLQEFRAGVQEGVKTITDRAKEDSSEENRRDAALARKSNQTFNYQRAVIDAYIRELIGLQRALEAKENSVSYGDEEPQLPDTDEEAWSRHRRTQVALDALVAWEKVRKEGE